MKTLDALVTERDLQDWVIEFARLHGWSWYHTHDSRRSPAGYPDICLARPGGPVIFVELKRENGRVTAEQRRWLDLLGSCPGVRARVVRPSDRAELACILQRRSTS
jgi:VRR-NUC domain